VTSYLTSDDWNSAVVYLEMQVGANTLSCGSAFFWRKDSSTFLVTNWHNLSGRNALTGLPMSATLALPDRITFPVLRRYGEPDARGFFEMRWVPITCALFEAGDPSRPRWVEHPHFGRKVDVAAIDVTSLLQGTLAKAANDLESDAIIDLAAAQDLFIVGFPFGLMVGGAVPLWKRGTIAADPNFDPEGLPKLLVDTATREGMSGSVAIARHIVVGRAYTRKDGSKGDPVLYATVNTVAGIYSGRHYPDFERAQLGIVWKRRVIDEVVTSGRQPNTGLIE
jgi:hypothetical protein